MNDCNCDMLLMPMSTEALVSQICTQDHLVLIIVGTRSKELRYNCSISQMHIDLVIFHIIIHLHILYSGLITTRAKVVRERTKGRYVRMLKK